ncbi:UvrD-helicase domain-containing protein [Actinomadura macrotermitis]|uniref:DNA helicase n=1 Tax=Actinomadura macrotermitis TaxID=2585200 RepID=A0A7K0C7R1_9ACTN|nr:UvrD-helicase domain-containing protein [Actinomadura macrotermitis]MQY09473.1 hypothetical protein [Actinomadura macrotermitis]
MALRPSYSGPAQVTGGAGTGKTVTALHRARHLAQAGPAVPVLLTTYTKSLAQALGRQLDLLVDDASVRGRIDVQTVDSLAYQIVNRHEPPSLVSDHVINALWGEAASGTSYSPVFLRREWEQIVLAQDLTTEQWRLLRRIVTEGPDDLFIVGDPHQRIYDSQVSLTSLGTRVRGRSSS